MTHDRRVWVDPLLSISPRPRVLGEVQRDDVCGCHDCGCVMKLDNGTEHDEDSVNENGRPPLLIESCSDCSTARKPMIAATASD